MENGFLNWSIDMETNTGFFFGLTTDFCAEERVKGSYDGNIIDQVYEIPWKKGVGWTDTDNWLLRPRKWLGHRLD